MELISAAVSELSVSSVIVHDDSNVPLVDLVREQNLRGPAVADAMHQGIDEGFMKT